jgi:hypothetical protein
MKSKIALFGFVVILVSTCGVLSGCSNPDGEGLSDQQKLDGAKKARDQQAAGVKTGQPQGGNMPLTRDSMPGASNSK